MQDTFAPITETPLFVRSEADLYAAQSERTASLIRLSAGQSRCYGGGGDGGVPSIR